MKVCGEYSADGTRAVPVYQKRPSGVELWATNCMMPARVLYSRACSWLVFHSDLNNCLNGQRCKTPQGRM